MIVAFKKQFSGINSSYFIECLESNNELLLKNGVYVDDQRIPDLIVTNTDDDEIIICSGNMSDTYRCLSANEYPINWFLPPSYKRTELVYYVSHTYLRIPKSHSIYNIGPHLPVPRCIILDMNMDDRKLLKLLKYAVTNCVPVLDTTGVVSSSLSGILYKCNDPIRDLADILRDEIFFQSEAISRSNKLKDQHSGSGASRWFVENITDVLFT